MYGFFFLHTEFNRIAFSVIIFREKEIFSYLNNWIVAIILKLYNVLFNYSSNVKKKEKK